MPYYRKRTYKKAIYPRKRYFKKRSTRSVAYKALSLSRQIARSQEKKYIEYNISNTDIDWSGNIVYTINETAQGTTDQQRIGDTVKFTWLTVRAHFNSDGTLASVLRVIIINDFDNQISDLTDILTCGDNYAVERSYIKDVRKAFGVLYDKTFFLNTYSPQRLLRLNMPLHTKTQYLSGSTTIATNALKMFFIANTDSASANKASTVMFVRLYYTDN